MAAQLTLDLQDDDAATIIQGGFGRKEAEAERISLGGGDVATGSARKALVQT